MSGTLGEGACDAPSRGNVLFVELTSEQDNLLPAFVGGCPKLDAPGPPGKAEPAGLSPWPFGDRHPPARGKGRAWLSPGGAPTELSGLGPMACRLGNARSPGVGEASQEGLEDAGGPDLRLESLAQRRVPKAPTAL